MSAAQDAVAGQWLPAGDKLTSNAFLREESCNKAETFIFKRRCDIPVTFLLSVPMTARSRTQRWLLTARLYKAVLTLLQGAALTHTQRNNKKIIWKNCLISNSYKRGLCVLFWFFLLLLYQPALN